MESRSNQRRRHAAPDAGLLQLLSFSSEMGDRARVLVYLNDTGRGQLLALGGGEALRKGGFQPRVAIALDRLAKAKDGFEGLCFSSRPYSGHHDRVDERRGAGRLKAEIEKQVEKHAAKSEFSAGMGLASFV